MGTNSIGQRNAELAIRRGEDSEGRVKIALGASSRSVPLVPMLQSVESTLSFGYYDRLGVDHWAVLAQDPKCLRNMLRIGTDRVGIQVKSSWHGIQEFVTEKEALWGVYGLRHPHRLSVVLLNGQRSEKDIVIDFAFAMLEQARLPRDPNDRDVLRLLNTCFHPDVVGQVRDCMYVLRRRGTIYDYCETQANPPIQGTVVTFPLRRPLKQEDSPPEWES